MSVKILTRENYNEIVENGAKPVLVDFYADWCGPCRMVSPIVDEIAEERDDIVVCKVNVDREPELSRRFGIVSIPTLIVLKDGEVVNKAVGAKPKDKILELVNV
ncbi:MAG: thioredoxin [Clostridia bacterium]|nr:thioredoxin [Clostridia bacterium]